ncbi:DUF317 domain-containing protein [Embleya sp. NBC_00896]|uniref:DUF317 domain-containing protein n=1 Tax=Embleya sp. NBC_00896 TaxID=2975961 RepID=UPI002F91A5AD|nr:DUF317 domain-containing protein [Embleya sp. NBC_00896]
MNYHNPIDDIPFEDPDDIPVPLGRAGQGWELHDRVWNLLTGWTDVEGTETTGFRSTSPDGLLTLCSLPDGDPDGDGDTLWRITSDLDPGRRLWTISFGRMVPTELLSYVVDAVANKWRGGIGRSLEYLEEYDLPTDPIDPGPDPYVTLPRPPHIGLTLNQFHHPQARVLTDNTTGVYRRFTVFGMVEADGTKRALSAAEGETLDVHHGEFDDDTIAFATPTWACNPRQALRLVAGTEPVTGPERPWRVIGIHSAAGGFRAEAVMSNDIGPTVLQFHGHASYDLHCDVVTATCPARAVQIATDAFDATHAGDD